MFFGQKDGIKPGEGANNNADLSELMVGTRVEYKTIMTPKGPWAQIVKIEDKELEVADTTKKKNDGAEMKALNSEIDSNREVVGTETFEGSIKTLKENDDGAFWGRITPSDGAKDLSFLVKNINDGIDLSIGEDVAYKVVKSPKGTYAKLVKVGDKEVKENLKDEIRHGKVIELSEKGFGKIKFNGGTIFFHSSALDGMQFNELEVGSKVLFGIEISPKKITGHTRRASNVKFDYKK